MMAEVVEEVDTDDVFEVETEKVVETEAKAEVAKETKTEEVEETEAGETTDPKDNEIAGLKAGIKAERQKKQEYKAELDKQKEAFVPPDPITDPEGYETYKAHGLSQQLFAERINYTSDTMRVVHDDFDEVWDSWNGLIAEDVDGVLTSKDDALYAKFSSSKNPAKFAYDHVKEQQKMQEVSADDYDENQRKKYFAEFEEARKQNSVEGLPDLTNAAASASNTVQEVKEIGSLEDDTFD